MCGFIAQDIPILVNHIINKHRQIVKTCNFCDYETLSRDDIIEHISSHHGDNDSRIEMANQIASLKESFESLETFKGELNELVKNLIGEHIAVKQELFMIRNNQANDTKLRDIDRDIKRLIALVETSPSSQPTSDASMTKFSSSKELKAPSTTKTPSNKKKESKILFVGDSISAHANIGKIAEATKSTIVTAKAYSAVYDEEAHIAKDAPLFPSKNFTDVVPAEVTKEAFKHLILQSGSVDISNLKTVQNPEIHLDYFQQKTVVSAQNIFDAGVNALKHQPSLEKVVILKQIPRYVALLLLF